MRQCRIVTCERESYKDAKCTAQTLNKLVMWAVGLEGESASGDGTIARGAAGARGSGARSVAGGARDRTAVEEAERGGGYKAAADDE